MQIPSSDGKEIGHFTVAEQQGTDTRMFPFLHERLDPAMQPFESLNRKAKPRGVSVRRRCSSSHAGKPMKGVREVQGARIAGRIGVWACRRIGMWQEPSTIVLVLVVVL